MQVRTIIGIAAASFAIAVPAAQANVLAAEGTGTSSAQSTPAADRSYQALANYANEQQRYQSIAEQPQAPVAVVSQPSSFDWAEFGLGGAAALAVLLALIVSLRMTGLTKPTPTESLRTS